jgi:hypothetical protein
MRRSNEYNAFNTAMKAILRADPKAVKDSMEADKKANAEKRKAKQERKPSPSGTTNITVPSSDDISISDPSPGNSEILPLPRNFTPGNEPEIATIDSEGIRRRCINATSRSTANLDLPDYVFVLEYYALKKLEEAIRDASAPVSSAKD